MVHYNITTESESSLHEFGSAYIQTSTFMTDSYSCMYASLNITRLSNPRRIMRKYIHSSFKLLKVEGFKASRALPLKVSRNL